jgi:transposase
MAAWRAKPRPTGPIPLAGDQWRVIPELLAHGAEAYGLRGECWTCARVATVIGEECRSWDHTAHVSRLLKRLHWTPQMPIERATQRDEAVIEQWCLQGWPQRKKRRTSKAGPSCLWTSRGFLSCQATAERMPPADSPLSCVGRLHAIICR